MRKGTPTPNRAKAHQGKAKPSKKHLKPAPEPKWGGRILTEAQKTNSQTGADKGETTHSQLSKLWAKAKPKQRAKSGEH